MKNSNDQTLADAIREMLQTYKLENKIDEVQALTYWSEIVGKMITQYTKDIYIRQGKLFVRIDSPALKNELMYARTRIIESLNERAGKEVVKELVFL